MTSNTTAKAKLVGDGLERPAQATSIRTPDGLPTHIAQNRNANPLPPYNTPAKAPPFPISGSIAPGVGRAIIPGSAVRGAGIPLVQAANPEIMPNSLEKISRRIASNLMMGEITTVPQVNRIAPSYEYVARYGFF